MVRCGKYFDDVGLVENKVTYVHIFFFKEEIQLADRTVPTASRTGKTGDSCSFLFMGRVQIS